VPRFSERWEARRRLSGSLLFPPTLDDLRDVRLHTALLPLVKEANIGAFGFGIGVIDLNAKRHRDGIADDERFTLAKRWQNIHQSRKTIGHEPPDIVLVDRVGEAEDDEVTAHGEVCIPTNPVNGAERKKDGTYSEVSIDVSIVNLFFSRREKSAFCET
jgi:hypothetical protein